MMKHSEKTLRPHFGLEIEKISYLVERKVLGILQQAGFDLTFVELVFLMTLVELGEASPAKLAVETLRDKAVVSRMTQKLLAKQYIQRINCELDGRSHLLKPSSRGKNCHQFMKRKMDPFRQGFEGSIDAPDFIVFVKVLGQFKKYLQEDAKS